MARPKKENQVEVVEQVSGTPVEVKAMEQPSNLNQVAIGLVELPGEGTGKTYKLVTINYNLDTMQAVIDKVENVGVLRGQANNRFKMAAVRNGLVKGK